MKTGWVMEWENEVRYAAPVRIHFENMNRFLRSTEITFRVMAVHFEETIKSLRKLVKALEV